MKPKPTIRALSTLLLCIACFCNGHAAETFQDRFVWIFGWNLNSDENVGKISRVLEQAGKAGLNGAVASFSLDTLCRQSPDYFRRLSAIQEACRSNHLELIPAVFSIGYGGGALSHDRNLAEGLPVQDALFVAKEGRAVFESSNNSLLTNGGFEEFSGAKAQGFSFHDDPGKITSRDLEVKHSGKSSLRLENFGADPHGHARAMQVIDVKPHRCYRVSLWVKTDRLRPANAFRAVVLADGRELAPRTFEIPETGDWRRISFLFNSLEFEKVNLYAGLWEGKSGTVWMDDWQVEEVGPVNPLFRPGTPTTVRSADGSILYEPGRDFEPLKDPNLQPFTDDKPALALRLPPGSRIRRGDRLLVSWYHSMIIHESQVCVCMGEPALYDIIEHEAALLHDKLRPNRVLLNMDEVRMGGTCQACAGKDMAKLLGECISRQSAALKRHNPAVQVYAWSDMLDPNHNAKPDYYLVRGDYTGSWNHVPRDLVIAVWGGAPRPESLRFFADNGFVTLAACYYDADDLRDVQGWLELARSTKGVRGLMYTPWLMKYDLLPSFGDLLSR